jgi:peptidoglycan/LPS O-acetylase OafA/YrhL
MLDQETIWQIAVAAGAVGLFLVLLVVVSSLFSSNGNISATGGFALVGAIVAFIIILSGAGLWLERQDFDENGS